MLEQLDFYSSSKKYSKYEKKGKTKKPEDDLQIQKNPMILNSISQNTNLIDVGFRTPGSLLCHVSKTFGTEFCRKSTLKMTWISLLRKHVISHLMVRSSNNPEQTTIPSKYLMLDPAKTKSDDFSFYLGLPIYNSIDKLKEIFDSLVNFKYDPKFLTTDEFLLSLMMQSKFDFHVLKNCSGLTNVGGNLTPECRRWEPFQNHVGLNGLIGAFLEEKKHHLKYESGDRNLAENLTIADYSEKEIMFGLFKMALSVWTVDCFDDWKPDSEIKDQNSNVDNLQKTWILDNFANDLNHPYFVNKRKLLIKFGYFPDVVDAMLCWNLHQENRCIDFELLLEIIRSVQC